MESRLVGSGKEMGWKEHKSWNFQEPFQWKGGKEPSRDDGIILYFGCGGGNMSCICKK